MRGFPSLTGLLKMLGVWHPGRIQLLEEVMSPATYPCKQSIEFVVLELPSRFHAGLHPLPECKLLQATC